MRRRCRYLFAPLCLLCAVAAPVASALTIVVNFKTAAQGNTTAITNDIVGAFCSSGAFRDLGPYIERDGVDLSQFSETTASYTQFEGTRCALPVLADAYGLYVNDDLLSAAGYDHAPTTLEELKEMALAMTTYNADGSIDVLGFNPLMGYYENTPTNWAMTASCCSAGRSLYSASHFCPRPATIRMTWLS